MTKPRDASRRDSPASRVLVLDDDVDATETMAEALSSKGHRVQTVTSSRGALAALASETFDVVLTDLQLDPCDPLDGLSLCTKIVESHPELPVVVVTGHASMEVAVSALRAGAHDFVTKPLDLDVLLHTIDRAVSHRRARAEAHRLRNEPEARSCQGKLLGESSVMRVVYDLIARTAATDATVLISGESGTGKELVARAIHDASGRAKGPFVAINCAAVPAQLLESELFGHVKGAFTDARGDRSGLFSDADGGTLFLDEIGEMPLEMQVKLLRALQQRTVRRVGGGQELPFNARIVAATNRNLDGEVKAGRFREDLYYRINVVGIPMPPLRDRLSDVPLLAAHFVRCCGARFGKEVETIAPPVMAKLIGYQWPGNVRELENAIERAVAVTSYDQLTLDDLPPRIREYRAEGIVPAGSVEELVPVHEIERRYMLHVLDSVGGNKSKAARILGQDRRTLYRKLARMDDGSAAPSEASPRD